MAEIYLVRHGQASFGTDNYDQLSATGEQQALRLGLYFKEYDLDFDHLVGGTMQRHRQTAEAIGQNTSIACELNTHCGWNEYDHEALFQAYIEEHRDDPEVGSQICSDYFHDRRLFYRILFRALPAWAEGRIEGAPETWKAFAERVADAMNNVANTDCSRALVSASGGSLSIAVMLATQMPAVTAIDLMRQMKNTAISQLFYRKGQWHLHNFNNLPHLESPTHKHLITYG